MQNAWGLEKKSKNGQKWVLSWKSKTYQMDQYWTNICPKRRFCKLTSTSLYTYPRSKPVQRQMLSFWWKSLDWQHTVIYHCSFIPFSDTCFSPYVIKELRLKWEFWLASIYKNTIFILCIRIEVERKTNLFNTFVRLLMSSHHTF